ncbi:MULTISPECIES: COG2958 family protein [unclassified Phaeobacter]|uniref:COG2958 family protein n=1 Tax=unclassified Phaeobacter TaxID=2621772 RepID=UPI003A87CB27
MTDFSITKFVPKFLKDNPEERFTAREIAQWITRTYPEATERKRLSSNAKKVPLDTPEAMVQQIVAEIGSQRNRLEKRHGIRTTEGRPRKYFFSSNSEEEEVSTDRLPHSGSATTVTPISFREQDLYPLFRIFLKEELNVSTRRIDERKSSNDRGHAGNKWLYPDVVGMEDLSQAWDREVIDCAKEYSDKKTKLWSFELKLKVNGSNLRESFFQAVSNSSWANFGYLVAVEFHGTDTLKELRLLSGLHGIGVIKFDPDDFSSSEILIPARERPDIDWGTVNRVVQQNKDFKEYIRLVRQFYQTGDSLYNVWHRDLEIN